MDTLVAFVKSRGFIRFLTLAFFVLLLYFLRDLINLILFTFIFTFLIGRLHVFLMTYLKKIMPINSNLVIILLYILIVALIVFGAYRYLPVVIKQVVQLTDQLTSYYSYYTTHPPDNKLLGYLFDKAKTIAKPTDLANKISMVYSYVTSVGKISVQILLALLLSLFFLLEKNSITTFSAKFRTSQIGPFVNEVEFFGRKFANTFGKVIEVQFLIAFTNAVISSIILFFLGFPKIFGLGVMILVFGLIPVAGVFISLVPLMTIAYTIGGGREIIYVLIMVVLIHALESYVLNPKFMSAKTNLPAFYTFIILIVSEHFLGIWGLIIGIPIFIFILDIMGVQNSDSVKAVKK
ncbi:AI-2E family transporter [Pullulanibacillus sp. KACC 23026]|uniref:AI-2E family transporter n=1 Tax=Pullulanibacillus sp. KACC 23026 TaxID=3028315 RepID=UPI0023B15488|nr:AI-2E family transporter [Pullulanibacillus sp. KACC 23026]WEG13811.1 AI-2E family transporter [Pullulanibacillus sp. KACC 23026]